ncbi:DUF1799 domain-containing protein [Desulfatitalea tepidiphila]|uniref:DUF1799 domain-containing protein n=1 Tax=Desulfatitalea tepidiphila TaxID=1185843 RepID=UPI0006B4CF35|nr:DUF1799 domain-containing protein [Desulfatitalea tepidiphila]
MFPPLWPENEEAFELWAAVCTQWRGAGLGLVGLDYEEVRKWAGDLEIELTAGVWRKIKALERHVLKRAEDAEGGSDGQGGGAGREDDQRGKTKGAPFV